MSCLLFAAFLAACTPKQGVDVTRFGLDDAVIAADLGVFPQDLGAYAERAGKDAALMDPDRQGAEDARFDEKFFAPWSGAVSLPPRDEVFEGVNNMNPAKGFAENLRPWDGERWRELLDNCDAESYGVMPPRPAITVTTAHLRRMPTDAPYFLDPGRGGEGFPFDYMQNSALWVGTPLSIVHISRDRMWVYAQTALVSGWTRVADIAAVDAAFIKAWRSSPLGVIVKDNVPLIIGARDAVIDGRGVGVANLGAILPFATEKGRIQTLKSPHILMRVPTRGADGKAVIAQAGVPMFAVNQKPVPLTPGEISRVGNAMMGQPYGWGGLFGQRDCSALMRDLFAPFGIWLPRNSGSQGRMGERRDLAGLTPDQKEETILREGVPFFSLIGMPGHVGLYLGAYPKSDGKETREVPVMFHSIWGLRVVNGAKEPGADAPEGRGIIGKSVVTGLRPGVEHANIASPAGILDRMNGLAILPESLPGEKRNAR